ncbi:glycosyltransferase [Sporosarcina sp. Te-1]|uniref:glycosyltransferase n=1 Tax=Sporosarcina sp. Te-1 TaxID=2818390 RepID=UPI001A9D782A|nr:glycosyltransferase [Sporosarcina sp. Te-1]QTD40339.1 glycosyltransferase [Sporosarcina sp. Te-1]
MRKKLLFISDHGDPLAALGGEQAGGQNNYVKQLALALDQKGHQVDVITHWADESMPPIESFGTQCQVIRIAAGKRGYVPKSDLYDMLPDFYAEMCETINLSSYDIMHTHYWLSGLLGLNIVKDFGVPWIHTSHSLGIAKAQATGQREYERLRAERIILEHADTIVATTKTERNLIQEFVNDPARIKVVPIGVDKNFESKPLPTQSESPYFAFAGRLESTKGIFTLIHAFRLLKEQNELPTFTKLVIAGGDANKVDPQSKTPICPKLKKAVHGLEDHIQFLGARTQSQLAQLFNGATAVVVPSTYESFGMVAAEAQACGCPVIASAVGGLKDVVQHRETGLHFERENALQLARAMKFLAVNQEFARLLGRKAASFARREFNWSTVAKKMDNIYEVVMRETEKIYAGD